jgi:hypothetical protein
MMNAREIYHHLNDQSKTQVSLPFSANSAIIQSMANIPSLFQPQYQKAVIPNGYFYENSRLQSYSQPLQNQAIPSMLNLIKQDVGTLERICVALQHELQCVRDQLKTSEDAHAKEVSELRQELEWTASASETGVALVMDLFSFVPHDEHARFYQRVRQLVFLQKQHHAFTMRREMAEHAAKAAAAINPANTLITPKSTPLVEAKSESCYFESPQSTRTEHTQRLRLVAMQRFQHDSLICAVFLADTSLTGPDELLVFTGSNVSHYSFPHTLISLMCSPCRVL